MAMITDVKVQKRQAKPGRNIFHGPSAACEHQPNGVLLELDCVLSWFFHKWTS